MVSEEGSALSPDFLLRDKSAQVLSDMVLSRPLGKNIAELSVFTRPKGF